MQGFMRTLVALAVGLLFIPRAAQADTADVSLAKEVERYLDQTAADAGGTITLEVVWKKGIRFKGENIEVKAGGRLMVDWVFIGSEDDVEFDADDDDGFSDGVFFRRVRLFWSGTVYKNTIFKVQIDFGKGSTSLADVWMGLQKLGFIGKMKVGHFKEPIGLEELTSSKRITFIERSATTNAFARGRNTGVAFSGKALEKRMTWAVGLFRTTGSDGANFADGDYALTLRLTGVLWQNKDEHKLIHGGFGFNYRGAESVRFRARAIHGDGDRPVDTGSIAADDTAVFNFEFAMVWGSLSVQAEVFFASVSGVGGAPDGDFTGFYVQVSYWITGEHRPYSGGVFKDVKVKDFFHDGDGGWGAWEIAFRFDTVDLNDGAIAGGEMDIFTVGVNWHWSTNARVMFNVIFADIDSSAGDGEITGLVIRFQWHF